MDKKKKNIFFFNRRNEHVMLGPSDSPLMHVRKEASSL